MSVSYTHLDVYKRQDLLNVLLKPLPEAPGGWPTGDLRDVLALSLIHI